MVAMYKECFLRRFLGGILPLLPAYSSTKNSKSTANSVRAFTLKRMPRNGKDFNRKIQQNLSTISTSNQKVQKENKRDVRDNFYECLSCPEVARILTEEYSRISQQYLQAIRKFRKNTREMLEIISMNACLVQKWHGFKKRHPMSACFVPLIFQVLVSFSRNTLKQLAVCITDLFLYNRDKW